MVLNKFTGSTKMDGTEQSLFKIVGTSMKHFASYVYLKALQAGESIRLRVYNKVDDVSHWKFDNDVTDSVSTNNGTVTNISSWVSQWKFDGDVLDSVGSNNGTITYNTNLKRLYKFESNLNDSTGAAANGTLGAGSATYVTGKEGKAFSFTGVEYITATDTGLQTANGAWSVTGWIYPTSFAANRYIYSYGTNAGNQAITISTNTSGKIVVGNITGALLTSTLALQLNTWYHVEVTYNGTTLTIYINSVSDSTAAPAALNITLAGASGQHIGAYIDNTSPFVGYVDELRNYNVALSQAQVSALYMNGKFAQSHTFDGGEYIQVSDVAAFHATAFSVSFWVNLPTVQAGAFTDYILKYAAGVNGDWFFDTTSSVNSSNIRFGIDTSNGEHATAGTTLSLGTWHHIVGTYDGTTNPNTIILYVDGVQSQTATSSGTWTPSNNTTQINIGGTNSLTGQIDELRFYSSALSASQVLGLYNYTGSNYVTPLVSGNALSLDGSSYVTITNQTPYNFERTNPFSMAFWVKTTVTGTSQTYVSKMDSSYTNGYQVGFDTNNQIYVSLRNTVVTNDILIHASGTINDGLWHNVIITYAGTSLASGILVYVDNVLQTNTVNRNALSATILNSVNITIGSTAGTGNTSGLMDEVQVWNYVVSSAERNAINAGRFANTHPIGLWHFDGDLYDYSGQGSTGSPTGTMTYVTGALNGSYNVPNTHFNFDGIEYISVGNPTNLQFERTQPFSIAFWAKTNASTSSLIPIIANNTNFDQKGIGIYLQFALIIVRIINTSSSNEISVDNSTVITPNDNLFHHYVVTYDGTAKAAGVKLYQDGVLLSNTVNTDNLSGSILSGNNWNIGSFSGGVSPTTAEMDDVRIYNRALSSAEVSDLYTYPDSAMKQLVYDRTYGGPVTDAKFVPFLPGNQYMVTATQSGCTNRIVNWEREEVS